MLRFKKHSYFVTFLFLLIFKIGHGQNLVPNSSFEIFTGSCSYTGGHDIVKATPWFSAIPINEPDYLNACRGPVSGVPTNSYGYQNAHTGVAYTQFCAEGFDYCTSPPLTDNGQYRTYLEVPLTSSLVSGQNYHFEMWVSLADYSIYATDGLQAVFSTSQQIWYNPFTTGYFACASRIPLTPSVSNSIGIISDKNGWTKVSGNYVASGGESYLIIGNFLPNSACNFSSVSSSSTVWFGGAVYYVDDIVVSPCTADYQKNILGSDTSLCGMNPFSWTLDASAAGSTYNFLWSNNATSSSITLTQPGTYWVKMYNANCLSWDTIVVSNTRPNVNLGPDTTLCPGKTLTLYDYNGIGTYRWENGQPGSYRVITAPGIYWLDVTILGCKVRDSVVVNYASLPPVNLGPDTIMCKNNPITYSLSYPGAKYLWSTGSTDSSLTVNNSGLLWGEINNSGCRNRDSVNIMVSPLSNLNLGPDTTLCSNQHLLLNATTPGATSYLWSTNLTNPIYTVINSGLYWVEAKNSNCKIRDTINVTFNPSPIVNLGNDTIICANAQLTLDAGNPGASYWWSNTSSFETIEVTKAGFYSVVVTKNNCSSTDSINVRTQNPPILNLGNDTTICEGSTLLINAASFGSRYLWQDSSMYSTLLIKNNGIYKVTVINGYCKVTDSINVNVQQKPYLNIGNDTSYCFNQPVLLDASQSAADTYLWQDNSTLNTYLANAPGKYWVQIKKAYCSLYDSVMLTQKSLPVNNLGSNKKICKENIMILDAGNPGSTYLWNNLTRFKTNSVNAPGMFFVKITNSSGCFAVDTISIDTFTSPIVSLGKDTFVCDGGTYQINAGTQFKSYLWQDASTNNFYLAKNAGTYFITIKDFNNCSASDTIQLSLKPKPIIDLSNLIKICEPDFILKTSGNNISYLWQDGSTSPTFHVTDYGNYSLTVTDSNYCKNDKQIEVISNCPGNVYVPNAFTPNGDGINDVFYPVVRNIKAIQFEIYNRWGALLFQTNEINKGWNGTFENKIVQSDVYVYKIIYTGLNDEISLLNGNVTLLR